MKKTFALPLVAWGASLLTPSTSSATVLIQENFADARYAAATYYNNGSNPSATPVFPTSPFVVSPLAPPNYSSFFVTYPGTAGATNSVQTKDGANCAFATGSAHCVSLGGPVEGDTQGTSGSTIGNGAMLMNNFAFGAGTYYLTFHAYAPSRVAGVTPFSVGVVQTTNLSPTERALTYLTGFENVDLAPFGAAGVGGSFSFTVPSLHYGQLFFQGNGTPNGSAPILTDVTVTDGLPNPIPEPASFLLLLSGLPALVLIRRKRQS